MCRTLFDVSGKRTKIETLTRESAKEGFWNEQKKASQVMKELEACNVDVERFDALLHSVADLRELSSISSSAQEQQELEGQYAELAQDVEALEFQTLLGGPYDGNDAIITITAGAGGTDAQDWAEMLMRMYVRFAQRKQYKAQVVDTSRGAEAGIKSATIEMSGRFAYGYLAAEHGVHRLVRLSPFNSDNLRQTSFARVEILPVIEDSTEVALQESDLKIDTFRSSGAGGQSVNTTDSAVRVTHVPTGIVVSCQNERSQLQNREHALKILRAKLLKKHMEEQEQQKQKLRGVQQSAEWGSQIRSYVLHPYKLVKDHRTKHESAQTDKVLEGEIDGFIDAWLRYRS